jgi:hypothetical protein
MAPVPMNGYPQPRYGSAQVPFPAGQSHPGAPPHYSYDASGQVIVPSPAVGYPQVAGQELAGSPWVQGQGRWPAVATPPVTGPPRSFPLARFQAGTGVGAVACRRNPDGDVPAD